MAYIVVVILLIFVLLGVPNWGYHPYGWYPSGGLGFLVIIVLILALAGRI